MGKQVYKAVFDMFQTDTTSASIISEVLQYDLNQNLKGIGEKKIHTKNFKNNYMGNANKSDKGTRASSSGSRGKR